MRDIQTRDDIFKLVSSFYEEVRQHQVIGSFFNETISDWDAHLNKLTDFWESNLFHKARYKGNPHEAHVKVDKKFNHTIEMEHFGKWIELWFSTIDKLYAGELAERAKNNARKMSTSLYFGIYGRR
ncbi:group III truncated hemoglobin [Galbibacter sp. EGI 63066]|uniref:group III truncated hemoglobin n=1 Tax=Galbibacter sp. EGI 63066 TaxID=2993559 RepID=UPI002248F8C7|nr:group III truncated hemoglobin [Galbibacter sp. EGI 63066]MCX2679287.1 group III truncated hemoglobin [Galbibacter sp. EGI 63066]